MLSAKTISISNLYEERKAGQAPRVDVFVLTFALACCIAAVSVRPCENVGVVVTVQTARSAADRVVCPLERKTAGEDRFPRVRGQAPEIIQ